jgi:hypothetical protein
VSQDVIPNEPSPDAAGGNGGTSTEVLPPPPTSCDALLNQPPSPRLTIRVRNERSQLIYVEYFLPQNLNCGDSRIARVQRAGADIDIESSDCEPMGCEDALSSSNGLTNRSCGDIGCLPGGFILEAGAEVSESIDREWYTHSLPLECFSTPPMSYSPQSTCLAYGPLVDGPYTFTVQAYSEVEPATVFPCFRLDGSTSFGCLNGTPGSTLIATASTNTPRGELSLVFQDDVTPVDAGEPNGPSPGVDAGRRLELP